MVAGCGKVIGDHGLGIKGGVAGTRFWEAGVEGAARNGAERSEVRSLERRLPKFAAPGGMPCKRPKFIPARLLRLGGGAGGSGDLLGFCLGPSLGGDAGGSQLGGLLRGGGGRQALDDLD